MKMNLICRSILLLPLIKGIPSVSEDESSSASYVNFTDVFKHAVHDQEVQVSDNSQLIAEINKFRKSLVTVSEAAKLDTLLQIHTTSADYRKERIMTWTPLTCQLILPQISINDLIKEGNTPTEMNEYHYVENPDDELSYLVKHYHDANLFSAELAILMAFGNHKYALMPKCVAVRKDNTKPLLVFQPVEGYLPSMEYVTEESRSKDDLRRISRQLLLAVKDLHSLGYLHGNLNAENILVDPQGNIKLMEFDYSRPVEITANMYYPYFISPELLSGTLPSEAIDMWAVGQIIAGWHHAAKHRESFNQEPEAAEILKAIDIKTNGEYKIYTTDVQDLDVGVKQLLYLLSNPNANERRFQSEKLIETLLKLPIFDVPAHAPPPHEEELDLDTTLDKDRDEL